MTFKELLDQIAEDYLNPETLSDGRKDADRNGHTRITDLQVKYKLSSLKIQKLLVTAGVYEPVKTDSSYYAVKRLREAGKSVDEIMKQLSLSKASVNACIPYERVAKELDKLGVEITGDAARKRKQRSAEEMRGENARNVLADTMSDDALWNALGEHDQITFVTEDRQRFRANPMFFASGQMKGDPVRESGLLITLVDSKGGLGETIRIPKEDVLAIYHKALELMAEGKQATAEELGDHGRFIYPLFIYLGVIDGDRAAVTTKRAVPAEKRCACCGRRTDTLYSVSSFEDLLALDQQFDAERESSWTEEEKEKAKVINFMMAKEQEYWRKQKAEQLEVARQSKAVEAFAEEGERQLCKLCCQTIYNALLNGILPPAKRTGGYDDVDDDELISFILEDCRAAKYDYYQAGGGVLKAVEFDNQSMFLFEVMDKHGITHSFALTANRLPYPEGDVGFGFDAREIHRLTKAGKVATDNTDTDYLVQHFKMCRNGEKEGHTALVGLVELIEKTIDTIRMESLSDSHSPAENLITINGHHYGIESLGTMIPTYVGYAENYRSMKDRDWDGSKYGFLIDGKLFTGDEVALMFSAQEGAQIKFYADDPSSNPLRADEIMMQVSLSQEELVNEVIDLINMFTMDGSFEREKDRENFTKLFEKYLLERFRLYHESRPRGYGRLAGMEIIKRLKMVKGTEEWQEMIRGIIGK